MLEEGVNVLICSRSADNFKRAAASLKQATGRDVRWFAADVTRAEEVQKLQAWVEREAQHLDILVSAVGGSRRHSARCLKNSTMRHGWRVMSLTCSAPCA